MKLTFKYCPHCGFQTYHNVDKCLSHEELTKEDKSLLHEKMHERGLKQHEFSRRD